MECKIQRFFKVKKLFILGGLANMSRHAEGTLNSTF